MHTLSMVKGKRDPSQLLGGDSNGNGLSGSVLDEPSTVSTPNGSDDDIELEDDSGPRTFGVQLHELTAFNMETECTVLDRDGTALRKQRAHIALMNIVGHYTQGSGLYLAHQGQQGIEIESKRYGRSYLQLAIEPGPHFRLHVVFPGADVNPNLSNLHPTFRQQELTCIVRELENKELEKEQKKKSSNNRRRIAASEPLLEYIFANYRLVADESDLNRILSHYVMNQYFGGRVNVVNLNSPQQGYYIMPRKIDYELTKYLGSNIPEFYLWMNIHQSHIIVIEGGLRCYKNEDKEAAFNHVIGQTHLRNRKITYYHDGESFLELSTLSHKGKSWSANSLYSDLPKK